MKLWQERKASWISNTILGNCGRLITHRHCVFAWESRLENIGLPYPWLHLAK